MEEDFESYRDSAMRSDMVSSDTFLRLLDAYKNLSNRFDKVWDTPGGKRIYAAIKEIENLRIENEKLKSELLMKEMRMK